MPVIPSESSPHPAGVPHLPSPTKSTNQGAGGMLLTEQVAYGCAPNKAPRLNETNGSGGVPGVVVLGPLQNTGTDWTKTSVDHLCHQTQFGHVKLPGAPSESKKASPKKCVFGFLKARSLQRWHGRTALDPSDAKSDFQTPRCS